MNYLKEKAIYHLSFFDRARQDGLIDMDFRSLYNGISSLFCLSEFDKKEVASYWKDEVFKEINTSETARLHLDLLNNTSFIEEMFGSVETERFAVRSKLQALKYYEKLLASDFDLISAFESNINSKQVSFSFALLYYLGFGSVPDKLFSQLKKNILSKDGADFDSLIFLLKTDSNNVEQYKGIFQKSSFKFYTCNYERISQIYFKESGGAR